MQVLELTRAGSSMTFEVFSQSEKIGTIVMGRGSFSWWGKGRQTGKRLSWTAFAKLLNKRCYGEP